MLFLREVPPHVLEGVQSGLYKVTGSVVRDVSTGRGVAFLQETGVMDELARKALEGLGATLQGGFSPLGILDAVQNYKMTQQLAQVQLALGVLQGFQLANLAASGLGVGVSALGFAVMLQRLKGIEAHLGRIAASIERVTADRRADDIRMIFADIGTQLDIVDTLSARNRKHSAAEATERALATASGRLEAHFQRSAAALPEARVTLEDLEMLWSLAAAIRLCHEAGLRALCTIDELPAARELAMRRAQRFLELGNPLIPDALARMVAAEHTDPVAHAEARRAALPPAERLVSGMRDSVAAIGSQSDLVTELLERGVYGPDYLAALEEEEEAPLLMLAA